MKWPWRRPEVRSANYTDQVIAQIMASATGASDGGALAAIETSARWWGLGLSSATVSPSNLALLAVTPSVLDTIGRALCRSGESLHVIAVQNGRVTLTPTASWTVQGDSDPASWMYLCTLNGPSTSRAITLPADSVLHVRYSPSPNSPWRGRSPMMMAADTARAAGLLEHATSEEMTFTQKQILSPRRNQGDDYGMADSMSPDQLTKIVEAFAAHTGSGAFVVPGDLEPRRLGPDPPATFPDLRDRLEHSILSMHGVPPALVAPGGTGTAAREAYRQILHGLIKPIGALVVEELREKLDPKAALSFDSLRAGDIVGSARALGSLVKSGGLTPQSAAHIVGFDDVEVSA